MVYLEKMVKENLRELQKLLEACADFLTFQDEKPVQDQAAMELWNGSPDGVDPDKKVVFGIFAAQEHRLIGVFDLIKAYPNPETLSLGLMLLEPASRNKGLGHLAYKSLEEWALDQNMVRVRLGVISTNEKGLSFWKSVGYIETGEIKPFLKHQVIIMEKYI